MICEQLSCQGIYTATKSVRGINELVQEGDHMWAKLRKELQGKDICVKPASDGCSTGVARLRLVPFILSYSFACLLV